MLNLVNYVEQQQMKKENFSFCVGDTVSVAVALNDTGNKKRIQLFEGFIISKKNRGVRTTITVRKMVLGEGVERIFQIHNKNVESITVVRKGFVRKSKLYYLRKLQGKSLKIKSYMK